MLGILYSKNSALSNGRVGNHPTSRVRQIAHSKLGKSGIPLPITGSIITLEIIQQGSHYESYPTDIILNAFSTGIGARNGTELGE